MKTVKIFYRLFLFLFCMMILASVWNYIFNFKETLAEFQMLGYPSHLIYPLVVVQILGLIILVSNRGKWLVEWAYAGFFMNMVFAIIAHYFTAQGNGATAVVGLILLWTAYVLNKKLRFWQDSEIRSHTSASFSRL